MKTYQVRIGTNGSIQEQVYRVQAKDMDWAEVEAWRLHDQEKHGQVRYVATSLV